MRQRSVASIIFGIVAGLILAAFMAVVPTNTTYSCNGTTKTDRSIATVRNEPGCTITKVEKGVPFAVRTSSAINTAPTGTTTNQADVTYQFEIGGYIGNTVIFGAFAILFFFLFSPRKKTQEMRKFSKHH